MVQPLILTVRRFNTGHSWSKAPKQLAAVQHVNTFVDIPLQTRIGVTANEATAGMFFLASPLAPCVTGHHDTLEVTGGRGI
ncbi:hypothetical protein DFJ58DRAFT_765666 [Suillus subalutaceus]|uniref:uncharacterized protein n=1 Tax=Suillus subalutaceus TaxID=48586 RepID=UPI001B871E41|nr:uncharacterized protein DFJ58DRAFT_765666 [Suillus subalutaceus]KAG1869371.1 hypothetical protein DFJ58DRAFT_765666 [Suillus subalutaceus]